MREYISLDLETTGLESKKDKIIEIGAVKIRDKEVQETYSLLVNPEIKIPERIIELTGINDQMVKEQPSEETAVKGLLEFCGELPLLGHNLMFDYRFVKQSAVNMGLTFEKKGTDTLKIARILLKDLESRSLQSLRKYYQIPQQEAHRALEDALTTFRLYERMRTEFEESFPELFVPKSLIYKAKRQSPVTPAQKRYLQDLVKYHKINLDVDPEGLTKNEASRLIDKILGTFGKIVR